MDTSATLQDLQAIHDQLATIERDLTAFPTDLAELHARLKASDARRVELERTVTDCTTRAAAAQKSLEECQGLEATAKAKLKTCTQGVQYQARLQEVFAREKATATAQKQLREPLARLEAAQAELTQLALTRSVDQAAFEEGHALFLGLHENQVVARGRLEARRTQREAELSAPEVARFARLLQARQGRAVVPTAGGICTGCRTKVRITLLTQLRETGLATCEACQRYLVPEARP